MRLILQNDAGDEVFDWTGERIDFAASVKTADKVHLCFDIWTDDAKAIAKATSAARKGAA